ncbi:hypothetical protein D3C74_268160 [compost metagenome]
MNKLHSVIKELAEVYESGGLKTTRFSITLTEQNNSKLEEFADKLAISKQDLINRLLTAAVQDLETALMEKDIDQALENMDKGIVPEIVLEDD